MTPTTSLNGRVSVEILRVTLMEPEWKLPRVEGVNVSTTVWDLAEFSCVEAKVEPVQRFYTAVSQLTSIQQDQAGWKLLHWLLVDPVDGIVKYTTVRSKQHESVVNVADLLQQKLNGKKVTQKQWAAEAEAARAAAAAARAAAAAAYKLKTWHKLVELLEDEVSLVHG